MNKRLFERSLSILGWAILASLAWKVFDWGVLNAVFRPDQSACQALAHSGACWGVIAEKYRPLLFGRYPYEQQWRPLLALLLMLGSALVVLWRPWAMSVRRFVSGALIVGAVVGGLLHGGLAGWPVVPSDQWGGLPLTVLLAWLSLFASLPLGIALAMGRRSRWRWLRMGCTTFIELTRGVPLVMVLFMAAFMLPAIIPAQYEVGMLWRVALALTLFSSAWMLNSCTTVMSRSSSVM